MLHIILLILKIIGIILLALLGLALFLLICVLCIPVRYSFDASIYDEKHGWFRISWFLRCISFKIMYDNGGMQGKLRVLGIPVRRRKKVHSDRSRRRKHQRQKKNITVDDEEYDIDFEQRTVSDDKAISDISHTINDEVVGRPERKRTDTHKNKAGKKFKFNIFGIFKKIRFKIRTIYDKLKKINNKRKNLTEFLYDEETREAWRFGRKEIKKVIRHILPYRLKINIRFGFSDPSYTGRMLGLIYSFYGYIYKYDIYPDFENKVFEGEMRGKGRIMLVVLLFRGFRLWRNPHIKTAVKNAKKI